MVSSTNVTGTNSGPNVQTPATTQAVMATTGAPQPGYLQVLLSDLPTTPGVAGSGTLWNNGGVPAIS
jgi:hypothetical protein